MICKGYRRSQICSTKGIPSNCPYPYRKEWENDGPHMEGTQNKGQINMGLYRSKEGSKPSSLPPPYLCSCYPLHLEYASAHLERFKGSPVPKARSFMKLPPTHGAFPQLGPIYIQILSGKAEHHHMHLCIYSANIHPAPLGIKQVK